MKKIIALALALIMALSMASVAFAATTVNPIAPAYGDKVGLVTLEQDEANGAKREWKISYDFTSSKVDGVKTDYKGAALIEKIEIGKDGVLSITMKENLTSTTEKEFKGLITLTSKTEYTLDANNKKVYETKEYEVSGTVANNVEYIEGEKKADDAPVITGLLEKNTVLFAEDGAGYVKFDDGFALEGTVKVAEDEKAQVYVETKAETEKSDEDLVDAIDAYLGEDYDAIVEWYNFCGTGFKNKVAFTYDAYAEDPHYFYAWDGEKFVDLEAKYNDDEDVEAYEFTADAKGVIIVTDVEIVAAAEEDTKNPDTGANDVVGVAAALAVVSLVAAGAVSLKK